MILPVPLTKYVPKLYRDRNSASLQALNSVWNTLWQGIHNDAVSLSELYDVEKTSNIEEIGYLTAARILTSDDERTARIKVRDSIANLGRALSFTASLKNSLDALTGLSSSVFAYSSSVTLEDMVWLGLAGHDTLDRQWMSWGTGTVSGDDTGMVWDDGAALYAAGNVLIDLGGDAVTPTAAVIEQAAAIVRQLGNMAYLRVWLGYVTGGSYFTVYAGGEVT